MCGGYFCLINPNKNAPRVLRSVHHSIILEYYPMFPYKVHRTQVTGCDCKACALIKQQRTTRLINETLDGLIFIALMALLIIGYANS